MTWNLFIWFAAVAVILWVLGAVFAWKERRGLTLAFTLAGILVFFAFILGMWISLERPPLKTMGETRLWYSFFVPVAGLIVYSRWRYKWILSFSTVLSVVFICVNLFKPEIHSKTLMPALQSPWFAPHVIVYMFAYALLGAATLMAIYLLFFKKIGKDVEDPFEAVRHEMNIADNLVYVGVAFLTFGMLFGALWAKVAWGDYWGWDPKETWAAITWLAYLVYIHLRKARPRDWQMACTVLLVAFVCLQMCWWGINCLPCSRCPNIRTTVSKAGKTKKSPRDWRPFVEHRGVGPLTF
jgi:ABC-type transport system involved in cytochrome c biogenesis permease subunit